MLALRKVLVEKRMESAISQVAEVPCFAESGGMLNGRLLIREQWTVTVDGKRLDFYCYNLTRENDIKAGRPFGRIDTTDGRVLIWAQEEKRDFLIKES